jgi:putative hydrolase of the HAD superfamily
MKIKAIIFDLFGTLIDSFSVQKYKQVLSEMASSLSLPEEPFYELWHNSFNQRALGTFKTLEESFKFISNKLDIPLDTDGIEHAIKIRLKYTQEALNPRDDAIPTLKQLKMKGYNVGLITDCTFEVPQIWSNTLFAPYFDSVIFSCVVGMKKPNPKIYRLACKELHLKPKNCIYVGDGSSQELTGALRVGMFPILIRSPHEKNSVRFDEEIWEGPRISYLREVLNYIEK